MGASSKIEWTDATWNPVRARTANGTIGWHCEIVTPGCERCYAQAINKRLGTGLQYLRNRERVEIELIPVHHALAAVIAASPCGNLAFLVPVPDAPFSSAGFGNLFREWCDAAGLPQCSAPGLRRAACRRLAELGCTAPQISAISGHKSLREVQRYIEEANQATLAQAAMARMSQKADTDRKPTQ